MVILQILVGIAVLALGRKLFWLFVGGVGFVSGAFLAARVFSEQPAWVTLLVALGAGVVGALLALFIQRLAVGLAAFLAGGYVAANVLTLGGWSPDVPGWLLYVAGGILGSVLVGILFDWALIVVSSLIGSLVVVQSVQLEPAVMIVLFVVLVAAGIAAQAQMMRREKAKSRGA
jgi:hypothetical protein